MKLLPWVLSLVLFVTSSVFAQDITTSQGTRSLPRFEGLTSENSLRQAERIAEIALGELTVDAAALDQQETTLRKEEAAYEQKKKDEQALLDNLTARFKVTQKKYRERLADYQKRKAPHDADAANQRAEAQASNSLPRAQRNAATVSRLNKWAMEIDARKALFDQERDILLEEHGVLETQRTAAINFEEGAGARLRAIHVPLQAKFATLNVKQGLAYRQLKQCGAYAVEIRKILKEKYKKADTHSPVLDLAMEQLKALSRRGFDIP